MTMQCDNCKGEGLVGSGDKPWLKEGAIVTCPICTGVGELSPEESLPIKILTGNEIVDNSETSEGTLADDSQEPEGKIPGELADPNIEIPGPNEPVE